MDFLLTHDDNGMPEITYRHSEKQSYNIKLGELFVLLMNCDMKSFSDFLVVEKTKWEQVDINKLKDAFKQMCKDHLPHPLGMFFYFQERYFLLTSHLDMAADHANYQNQLIDFNKAIYESITHNDGKNFEIPSWATKVEYINGKFTEILEFVWLSDLMSYCLYQVFKINITINKCANCGKYFIPSSRADEIYCDNIFKGNRTCKQIGYEQKVKSDEFMRAYRTAYKTMNAKKNRNIKNNPHAEKDFAKWTYAAKDKLDAAQNGKISLAEFKEWLKN